MESLVLVPERPGAPLAAASAGDTVYLLGPERDPTILHSVYGHPVTCLDAGPSRAALGVKSSGWAMHDGGNKVSHLASPPRNAPGFPLENEGHPEIGWGVRNKRPLVTRPLVSRTARRIIPQQAAVCF